MIIFRLIVKVWRKFFFVSSYLISIPLASLIYSIYPFYKIKFIALFSERIGHYALNTELMLCEMNFGKPTKRTIYLFYTRPNFIPLCNQQLHRMWRRVLPVFPFPVIAEQTDLLLKFFLGKKYTTDKFKVSYESAIGAEDHRALLKKIKHPHLYFTNSEITRGEKLLNMMGIPASGKIIYLVVRDSAYLNAHLPGNDWQYHDFRDAAVDNYKKAALFLAEKGYYVFRMGKVVAKSFDVMHKHVFDYATSECRSDFLDIYLAYRCYFFISTVTGLDCVPQILRKPGVFTNVALPGELLPWHPNKLLIPKKIKHKATGNVLSFSENYALFKDQWGKSVAGILKAHDLEMVQNTEDEILDVVVEMEQLMQGKNTDNKISETELLQEKFWAQYPKRCRTFFLNQTNCCIKVGSAFLQHNKHLL